MNPITKGPKLPDAEMEAHLLAFYTLRGVIKRTGRMDNPEHQQDPPDGTTMRCESSVGSTRWIMSQIDDEIIPLLPSRKHAPQFYSNNVGIILTVPEEGHYDCFLRQMPTKIGQYTMIRLWFCPEEIRRAPYGDPALAYRRIMTVIAAQAAEVDEAGFRRWTEQNCTQSYL